MRVVESKVIVELTLQERDMLCNWVLHELGNNTNVSMPMEMYDFLKGLAIDLAPDWD